MYIILDGTIDIGIKWNEEDFKASSLKDVALDIGVDKNPLEKEYCN